MKITPKFTCTSGSFDTNEVIMKCVISDKYKSVDLCIKEDGCNWNIPIGNIKLYDRDLYVNAKETFEDSTKLGNEIARRWNEHQEWHDVNKELPEELKTCLLRVEQTYAGMKSIEYVTSRWNSQLGWCFNPQVGSCVVTHWQYINTFD